MKIKLLLMMAALLLIAPFSRAENCNSVVIDKAGVINNPAIINSAARTLINQGADVHVVVVDSISRYGASGLAGVETYFEQSCPNWVDSSGRRKANLFVVMVAPNERAKNMFLGSYYNGAFNISSTYSQLSNVYFKDRQWEIGLASVLQGTTSQALSYRQHAFTQQQQRQSQPMQPAYTQVPQTPVYPSGTNDDSGISGLAIFFIVLIVLTVVGAVVYYFVFISPSSTATNYDDSDVSVTPSYSASPRPRSYAAAAPSHTTVINNNPSGGGNFVAGMLVGEALSRPSQPQYTEPTQPTYVEPAQPTYVDPAPPVQDAPDSSWEDTSSSPDTSSSDTGFSMPDSSGGDSGF